MSRGRGTPHGKRTRWLLARLPVGYAIEKRGHHLSVLRPDGEPLRDERGMPVLVVGTGTGSEQGGRRDLDRIRRAIEAGP